MDFQMDYQKAIASCDERIADINGRIAGLTEALDNEPFIQKIKMHTRLKFRADADDALNFVKKASSPTMDYFNQNLKMVKIEKLIYHAIMQYIADPSKQAIFKFYNEKYDDLLTESLETLNKMVKTGMIHENQYLDTCNEALKQQKYIKVLCKDKDEIINPAFMI
jgi:hypothetical protein